MALVPGSIFAGYLIKSRLGAGGMGVVYLARHPRLKRDVALKVLHDQWALDTGTREAFERETAVVSQLDHPNIVQVYDRSDPDDEALWLSMRHVSGGDVAALLAGAPGGLPIEQIMALLTDTAHALDYAHTQGVLHRDVKPANLLLEYDARHGQKAVLTDFGIARVVGASTTVTGIAMSLPYAAPERFTGEPVDHRADIYSLGCTLFQLFTGQVPFPRNDPGAVLHAHLNTSAPSARALRHDLPAYADAVVATAMAKDPVYRYKSAQELVSDLLSAISTTAHTATPTVESTDTAAELEHLSRAHYDDTDPAAEYHQQAVAGDEWAMHSLARLLKARGETAEAEFWYRKSAAAENDFSMLDLAKILLKRGELDEAEAWCRKSAAHGNQFAMYELGSIYKERGDSNSAELWYRKSAAAGSAWAMRLLGELFEEQSDLDEAELWYRRAIQAGDSSSMRKLGLLLEARGEADEALDWLQRANAAL